MAKARALDKRRKSIRNIRKITRTMELISTARFKQGHGSGHGRHGLHPADHRPGRPTWPTAAWKSTHPLLEPAPEPRRAMLLVLTANRGLCGGYNGSVLRLANARYSELQQTT